jgi:hypothetical protein
MILSHYRGFDVFRGCRKGSPCEKEIAGFGAASTFDLDTLAPDVAANEAAAAAGAGVAAANGNMSRLAWGVGTGLAVWILTRLLDKHLFKGA